jgi:hypothetical protein
MDIKILLAIVSSIIGVLAYAPYLRDIFRLKTKPHVYTWLIWVITQGTAVYAIWYGGGSWGALSLTLMLLLIFIVFLFSLKHGTKNITKSDTFVLILAILAILVWWQLHQPVISVLMVTAADLFGYIPTFRKSYYEPWSETLSFWFLTVLSNITTIVALQEYNLLTLTYVVSIATANLSLLLLCFFRRQFVKKPK